jgi:hypothetical protein
MALQTINNGMGFPLDWAMKTETTTVATTIDAVGESVAYIGKLYLQGGAVSKTISSAGGKIVFRFGTITGSIGVTSTLRAGIQDVAATGLEDGTYDTYGEWIGIGYPGANSANILSLSSGSKTVSTGDLVALKVELTVLGGSEVVQVLGFSPQNAENGILTSQFPYRVTNGTTKSNTAVSGSYIITDDGTIGWIEPFVFFGVSGAPTADTLQTGNIRRYGASFEVPFKCSVRGAWLMVAGVATTEDFDFILYSDPFGTPVAERTVNVDASYFGSTAATAARVNVSFSSFTLNPGTTYAVIITSPASGAISGFVYIYSSFDFLYDVVRAQSPFDDIRSIESTSTSGAMTDRGDTLLTPFGLLLDKLDDGAGGSGGGEHSYTF